MSRMSERRRHLKQMLRDEVEDKKKSDELWF
nr:hypothetical protein BSM_14140 [uncultured archaeon]